MKRWKGNKEDEVVYGCKNKPYLLHSLYIIYGRY